MSKVKSTGFSLTSLASPSTTILNLLHPANDEPLEGVFIEGYTSDSKEYKALERKIKGAPKDGAVILKKKHQEIKIDASNAKDTEKLLIASITDIRGIDGLVYSEGAKEKLLANPDYKWMLEQWGAHCTDRSAFFTTQES